MFLKPDHKVLKSLYSQIGDSIVETCPDPLFDHQYELTTSEAN